MKPFESIKSQELPIPEHVQLLKVEIGAEMTEVLVRKRIQSLQEYRSELILERQLVENWISQGEKIINT